VLWGEAKTATFNTIIACSTGPAGRTLKPVVLLGLMRDAFVPEGPRVSGIDETSAWCHGSKIAAQGIYRDLGCASHAHVVKASGLQWVSLRGLAHSPWADRVWALPFLTVLAPLARYDYARGRRPPSLLDRARQTVRLVRRWLPTREVVVVGDSTYAARQWLDMVHESKSL